MTANAETTPQRRTNWLLSFTGLLPVLLALPILLLRLWALGIALTLVSSILVVGYHLRKGQGITALDFVSLGFGLANAGLYFGFGVTVVLEHLDTTIYGLLFFQVAYAQFVRGEPWTTQYAKRSVSPGLWEAAAFRRANRAVSLVWGACFFVCALASTFGSIPQTKTVLPVIMLVLTAGATPWLARWYGRRTGTSPENPR